MTQVRVIVEYIQSDVAAPVVRWERIAATGDIMSSVSHSRSDLGRGTFELLGRAFEVAMREEGAGFSESLVAFFRGAVVRKPDIVDVIAKFDDHAE